MTISEKLRILADAREIVEEADKDTNGIDYTIAAVVGFDEDDE